MRIYINARFLTQSITGVQRYSHELIRAFDNLLEDKSEFIHGNELILLAPTKGIKHSLKLKNIKLKNVGKLTGHAWEQFELPFYSKDGLLFSPGNTAPLLSLLLNRKNVVTVHSLAYKYFPTGYNFAFKLLYGVLIPAILRFSDKVITVSNSERQYITQNYPIAGEKIIAIQNGGFSKFFLENIYNKKYKPIELDKPYLLYVGALNKTKNPQGIIEAIKIIKDKCDVNLVIVGASEKSFSDFDNLLNDDIKNRIKFTGQINNTEDLISYYLGARAFVFPSFYEASPLPPIEAMACGVPVISSSIASLQERCGDSVLYCDANDSFDISQKILSLINDNKLHEQYSQLGREHAKIYTWENCAIKTIKVINDVFSGE